MPVTWWQLDCGIEVYKQGIPVGGCVTHNCKCNSWAGLHGVLLGPIPCTFLNWARLANCSAFE